MGTIGEKRKRIRIERQVAISDGQGGQTLEYELRGYTYAHERPLSGTEALDAQQLTAVLSSVWEIPFRDDLRVTDRLVYATRKLEIQRYIDPKDDRRELFLFCSEAQDAGVPIPVVTRWVQDGLLQPGFAL